MRISRNTLSLLFQYPRYQMAGMHLLCKPARHGGHGLACLVLAAMPTAAGCSPVPVVPVRPVVPDARAAPLVRKPLKIGLALGGGAARGFAHVGVIAVLEAAGLKPHLVAGTSAGSLVALIYATGTTSAQLQQIALGIKEVAITDWMLPIIGKGMFRGDALGRYVNQLVGGRLIESMAMLLAVVAIDLHSGGAVSQRRYRHGGAGVQGGAGSVRAGQDQRA